MSGSNSLTEISIASHFKRSSVAVSWALHFPLPRSKIQGEMSGSSSFAMKSISLSFKTPSYMWWWFVLSSPLIVLVLDHYLTRRNSFMMRQPCFCVCFLVVAVEYSWHLFWIVIVFRIVSIFWSLLDVSGWSMLSFSYLFYFVVDGSFFFFSGSLNYVIDLSINFFQISFLFSWFFFSSVLSSKLVMGRFIYSNTPSLLRSFQNYLPCLLFSWNFYHRLHSPAGTPVELHSIFSSARANFGALVQTKSYLRAIGRSTLFSKFTVLCSFDACEIDLDLMWCRLKHCSALVGFDYGNQSFVAEIESASSNWLYFPAPLHCLESNLMASFAQTTSIDCINFCKEMQLYSEKKCQT